MADIRTPTEEDRKMWTDWVNERPEEIKRVAERFFPWKLYQLQPTGNRVILISFEETDPVTITVRVLGRFNAVLFERDVFGIRPEDLKECDLPSESKLTGVLNGE